MKPSTCDHYTNSINQLNQLLARLLNTGLSVVCANFKKQNSIKRFAHIHFYAFLRNHSVEMCFHLKFPGRYTCLYARCCVELMCCAELVICCTQSQTDWKLTCFIQDKHFGSTPVYSFYLRMVCNSQYGFSLTICQEKVDFCGSVDWCTQTRTDKDTLKVLKWDCDK